MNKKFVTLENVHLPSESIELLDDELIFIPGGLCSCGDAGSGCHCGCTSDGTSGAGGGCNCDCGCIETPPDDVCV